MNTKYIKEFEILEGIPYDKSDEKALAKFERYVERQEKERKEDFNNKDNWEFERSSGYAGYRNEMTGDWIYEPVYLELFAEKVKFTKEQIINTMHQVELEDDKDYSKLFNRVLQKLNEL